jgi:hypothetical protein
MWQQRRKNPPPAVREAQGNGIYLLAYGEPHDPCPVAGCGGPYSSCTGEAGRMWSAVCSLTSTAGHRPGAKMTPGGGSARSRAPIAAPSRS